MNSIVYVNTGELKYGENNIIFNSGAIGSCIVVTIFDKEKHTGAMAHIMLPGESPKKHKPSNKYAADAIRNLHNYFLKTTSKSENLICCIVGGANVLRKKDDNLCRDIINSVEEEILKNNLVISKKNIGGELRRTMQFDTYTGDVFYSIENSGLSLLWSIDN